MDLMKYFSALSILFVTFLTAEEPTLAKLIRIDSTQYQRFQVGTYQFTCSPYGIRSVDDFFKISKEGSTCRKAIQKFYDKHPELQSFIYDLLMVNQWYHYEIRDNSCILFAKGQKTLSEILLEKGLAIQKPFFKDNEFNSEFKRAQNYAKMNKKGMWDSLIMKHCVSELYK